jgi:hypothetical protein
MIGSPLITCCGAPLRAEAVLNVVLVVVLAAGNDAAGVLPVVPDRVGLAVGVGPPHLGASELMDDLLALPFELAALNAIVRHSISPFWIRRRSGMLIRSCKASMRQARDKGGRCKGQPNL